VRAGARNVVAPSYLVVDRVLQATLTFAKGAPMSLFAKRANRLETVPTVSGCCWREKETERDRVSVLGEAPIVKPYVWL